MHAFKILKFAGKKFPSFDGKIQLAISSKIKIILVFSSWGRF